MPREIGARLRRTVRRAGRHGPGSLVLVYHRVARSATDPQLLCVTPERFAEQLEMIAQEYEPLPLAELVDAAAQGHAPRNGVAVTFDDGYADNLLTAKPLLARTGVPATVFVTSGFLRSGRHFWWDDLESALLHPGRLPPVLSLNVEGEAVEAELGRDADYPPSRAAELGRWNVLDRSDPGPRQRLYRFLCGRLRALCERERDEVLDQLRTTVTPNDAASGDRARPLTPDELVRLAGGAVAIGAHTVTHPVLSALPPARQADEIITSRRQLEEILARPVDAFAYPYGAPGDFDATTVSLVREAGFTHAYANVAGRVDGRTDRFRIPRGLVRDWSADELEQRMAAIAA